jgi:hypothetical protein
MYCIHYQFFSRLKATIKQKIEVFLVLNYNLKIMSSKNNEIQKTEDHQQLL